VHSRLPQRQKVRIREAPGTSELVTLLAQRGKGLLGGTLAQELLSLFVGEDRSTSPSLPEVLSVLTGYTGMAGFIGMPVVNRTTAQAAGREERSAYDAVIVSS
jgi:hypothetical protein